MCTTRATAGVPYERGKCDDATPGITGAEFTMIIQQCILYITS